MPKLTPPITVTMDSFDSSTELTATATHYRERDEDHCSPYIDSWSVEDSDGDEPDYRSDEEAALGALLDEALAARLDAEREDDDDDKCGGIQGAIVGRL